MMRKLKKLFKNAIARNVLIVVGIVLAIPSATMILKAAGWLAKALQKLLTGLGMEACVIIVITALVAAIGFGILELRAGKKSRPTN